MTDQLNGDDLFGHIPIDELIPPPILVNVIYNSWFTWSKSICGLITIELKK